MGSTNVRIGSTIFGPREYPKKKWTQGAICFLVCSIIFTWQINGIYPWPLMHWLQDSLDKSTSVNHAAVCRLNSWMILISCLFSMLINLQNGYTNGTHNNPLWYFTCILFVKWIYQVKFVHSRMNFGMQWYRCWRYSIADDKMSETLLTQLWINVWSMGLLMITTILKGSLPVENYAKRK